MSQPPLDPAVKAWLKGLPKEARVKQRRIAEENTARIAKHMLAGAERKAKAQRNA